MKVRILKSFAMSGGRWFPRNAELNVQDEAVGRQWVANGSAIEIPSAVPAVAELQRKAPAMERPTSRKPAELRKRSR